MRIAGLALALGVLAAVQGCASNRYSLETTISSGQRAVFGVACEVPFVTIRNQGPNAIGFEFRPEQFEPWAGTLEVGSIGKSLRGGGEVRVETADGPTALSVEAQRATGMSTNIEPAQGPTG